MSSRKNLFCVLIVTVILLLVSFSSAFACTDIVVGRLATVDGSVITSHTVDGRYDSRIQIIPAAHHEPGTMAPVWEWIVYADRMELVKLGEIPQVEYTYQYFLTAYPPANEHQLIIGETTLGGARETINSPDAIMTIEQLTVFALQRTKTAREAILLMGELAVQYGFRESCSRGECLTVTDPYEAWVFEVYGVGPLWHPDDGTPGAVWAAQRVPDDHVTVVPNHSRIGEIDPVTKRPPGVPQEDFMICDNYLETAIEMGRYDPGSGEPFVWKYVYGDVEGKTNPRLWRVYDLLQPSGNWEYGPTHEYPFSIKPDEKVSVFDIIEIYRDVMEGTPYYAGDHEALYYESRGEMVLSPLAGPEAPLFISRDLLGVPRYRTVAVGSCSNFWVSQARSWLPDPIGGVLWFGLNNPHKSPFIPLYVGNTKVPESWVTLDRDRIDFSSAWWAFGLVDKISNYYYQQFMPRIDAVRVPFQQDLFRNQAKVEEVALALYNVHPVLAIEFLTNYTYEKMVEAEQLYSDLWLDLLFRLPGR